MEAALNRFNDVLTFVEEKFHPSEYNCRKLSIYVTFALLKIGFSVFDILLLDSSIYRDNYISYYEMKSLGFSRNEIHAIFYLVNHKKTKSIFKAGSDILKVSETNLHHDCSICLETLCADGEVVQLPCGHLYHEMCILEWLKANFTCPFCRKEYSLYPSLITAWIKSEPLSVVYMELIQQQCKENIHLIK